MKNFQQKILVFNLFGQPLLIDPCGYVLETLKSCNWYAWHWDLCFSQCWYVVPRGAGQSTLISESAPTRPKYKTCQQAHWLTWSVFSQSHKFRLNWALYHSCTTIFSLPHPPLCIVRNGGFWRKAMRDINEFIHICQNLHSSSSGGNRKKHLLPLWLRLKFTFGTLNQYLWNDLVLYFGIWSLGHGE